MNIEEILDIVDDMIEESWSVPFASKKGVIDTDKIREYIDDIRMNLPAEIKQAKLIVSERNQILKDARKEAESIVRRAEEKSRALIAQEEVVRQSQAKAADLIAQAQNKSKEMRYAAKSFSDEMLKQTEDVLAESLRDVKSTRQALKVLKVNKQA